jgi:DNA-binding MarR family transcriptional regulator
VLREGRPSTTILEEAERLGVEAIILGSHRPDFTDYLLGSTAARVVRWVPKEHGFGISLAAARLLARLQDNGPTRISELAVAENCSQPTITNHVKRLEAARLVDRTADPRDARAWMIKLTKKGDQQLSLMRDSIGTSLEPYLAAMSRRDLKALREGIDAMQRLMAMEMETQRL